MTVLYLTNSLSVSGGGVTEAVSNLAGNIARNSRHAVCVMGSEDGKALPGMLSWPGVEPLTRRVRGPASFGYTRGLEAALYARKPDLIHVHGMWAYTSVIGLRWGRRGHPYLVSPHGMLDPWALRNSKWKKRIAGLLYEWEHLRGAKCLHALNAVEAKSLRACGLRNQICVIPNGVDVIETDGLHATPEWRAALPAKSHVLLYLGRLHRKKGLNNLLKGWARAQKLALSEGWFLVIAGWDQEGHRGELVSLAAELGISSTTRFVGAQFGSQKESCFSASDAFILPSYSEGLPIVILEAWARALPVLITDHCNLPEGFAASAAIRVEAEPEDIHRKLIYLLGLRDEERSEIGRRGKVLVQERFSWPVLADKMMRLYDWAMGSAPRPEMFDE